MLGIDRFRTQAGGAVNIAATPALGLTYALPSARTDARSYSPGHMTRSSWGARMMSAREPRLEESVMASVLLMARMEVSALLSLRARGVVVYD